MGRKEPALKLTDKQKELIDKYLEINSAMKETHQFPVKAEKNKGKLTLKTEGSKSLEVLCGSALCVINDERIIPANIIKRMSGKRNTNPKVGSSLANLAASGYLEKIQGTYAPTEYKLTDKGYKKAENHL